MRAHEDDGGSSTHDGLSDEFEKFEMVLRTLSERVRTDDALAHELYGALCNMR